MGEDQGCNEMLEAELHSQPKSGKGSQGEDINLRETDACWSPFTSNQGDEPEEAAVSSCHGCGIILCNYSVLHVRDGEGGSSGHISCKRY